MTTINQLPLVTALVSGDQLILWATNNGDSRRVPFGTVKAIVLADAALTGQPTLNGEPVTVGADDSAGSGFRVLRVPNA